MHPTPRTSTSVSNAASLTAFSKASFTFIECEDRHPAAMQQRTTFFFRDLRSCAAISFNSSMTIVHHPVLNVANLILPDEGRLQRKLLEQRMALLLSSQANPYHRILL